MSFGDQLKKRREELGLSRSELADRLGVSRSAVGNYETGVSAPKEEVLLRLFDALHVEPNYLYRGCAGDHAAGAAGRRPGACAPCHPAVLLPGCSGLCRPGIRGGL